MEGGRRRSLFAKSINDMMILLCGYINFPTNILIKIIIIIMIREAAKKKVLLLMAGPLRGGGVKDRAIREK